MVPSGDVFEGAEAMMEINTAKWELNLRLLEMAHGHSQYLLCNTMQRMVKTAKYN
jgi:hypothetical protein